MAIRSLPRAQAGVNKGGPFTAEWYDFFRDLRAFVVDNEGDVAQIDDIIARLDALENQPADTATINGLNSVQVTGSLESGLVQIQLQGDSNAPGASYYYGTDAAGVKGFWPALANPMTTLGDVIKGGVGGTPERLGVGADGEVLGVVSGEPGYVVRVATVVAGTNITVDSTDPLNPIVSASGGGEGGIGVSIGTYLSTATVLPAGTEATSIADAGYDLSGDWYLWCYPSGSIEIDVWKDAFGNIPTIADSICGGMPPAVVGGTFASGTFAGPVSIARTDTLLAHINSNANVKWVKLLLIGDKT